MDSKIKQESQLKLSQKPPLSAFFALNAALMAVGYTVTLKPVCGVNLRVIERAA
jgi:hypothetical protein